MGDGPRLASSRRPHHRLIRWRSGKGFNKTSTVLRQYDLLSEQKKPTSPGRHGAEQIALFRRQARGSSAITVRSCASLSEIMSCTKGDWDRADCRAHHILRMTLGVSALPCCSTIGSSGCGRRRNTTSGDPAAGMHRRPSLIGINVVDRGRNEPTVRCSGSIRRADVRRSFLPP